MGAYELATVIVSLAALAISVHTLITQRKLQKESNELQRATSALAKKQLEMLGREDQERLKARVKVDLVKDGKSYRFVISNFGNVDARNVDFELLLGDADQSPLIESDRRGKLPALKLSPGSSISLIAAIHMQSPRTYRAELRWLNPDGTEAIDEAFMAL